MRRLSPSVVIGFIAFLILVVTSSYGADAAGKCVPFPTFSGIFQQGYNEPICASVLKSAGHTHFWVDDDAQSSLFPGKEQEFMANPVCAKESFYFFDNFAQLLSNAFTATQPAPICQSALVSVVCLYAVPVCDPTQDITEYKTEEKNKPCNFFCDIFHTDMDSLCSDDDLTYLLTTHKIALFPQHLQHWPQLDCLGSRWALPEATECLAPTYLSTEPIAARCEEYNGTICSGVFPAGTQVYIPAGMTMNTIEQTLAGSAFVLNALPNRDQSTCADDTIRLYCQSMLRECLSFGVSKFQKGPDGYPADITKPMKTNIALPLNPPMSSCSDYKSSCSDVPLFQFYRQMVAGPNNPPVPLITCEGENAFNSAVCIDTTRTNPITAPYAFNQRTFFGEYEYAINYFSGPAETVYAATSFAASQITSVQYLPLVDSCTSPLIIANGDVSGINTIFGSAGLSARCTFPCPTPIYSSSERSVVSTASWVFIVFSLIFSAILALSFTIFHSQRHRHLLFNYIISYFGAVLTLFIGMLVRKDGSLWNQQCRSEYEYSHMRGWGLAQALFLVYFLCASSNWWLIQAIDVYQRLIVGINHRRGSREEKRRRLAMHLFAWITPLFVIGAAVTAGQFGYDGILAFAWFVPDPTAANLSSSYSAIIVFFLLMVLSLVAGLVLIGIVLVYLIKYTETKSLKKFVDQMEDKNASKRFKVQQVLKLLGFSLIPILFYVSVIVYFIISSSSQADWESALIAWGRELVLSQNGMNYFTLTPTPDLKDKMPVGLAVFLTFGLCSQGFIIFLLHFVLSSDIYGLWFGLFYFKLGIQCCQRWAKEDTTTGSDASGSGGSSGGGSSQGSTQPSRAVSNDLMSGGGILLTKKARAKQAAAASQDGSGHNNSTGSDQSSTTTTNNNSSTANPTKSQGSAPPASRAASPVASTSSAVGPRKQSLFKGMSKASSDHRWKKNGRSVESGSSDLEMGNFGEIDNQSFGDRSTMGVGLQTEEIFHIEEEGDDGDDEQQE